MNLFICQTPFQVYFSEAIIQNAVGGYDQNVIIYSSGRDKQDSAVTQYIKLNRDNGFRFLLDHYRAKKHIDRLAKQYKSKLTVFIPHTGALLTNYVFHASKFKRWNVAVNLFYEGILYFYAYKEPYSRSHQKRKWMGKLLGISYQYNAEILPVNASRIHKILTPFPDLTIGPSEKKVGVNLQLIASSIKSNASSCLILGGPIPNLSEVYDKILEEVVAKKFEKVYYKGHHAFNTTHPFLEHIFSDKAMEKGISYESLENDGVVEEDVQRIFPQVIYACFSSALVNMKVMYGEGIEMHAYTTSDYPISDEVLNIYNDLNISIQ